MAQFFKNQNRAQGKPAYAKFVPNYVQRDIVPEHADKRVMSNLIDAAQSSQLEDDLFDRDTDSGQFKYLIKDSEVYVPEEYLNNKKSVPQAKESLETDLSSVVAGSSIGDYIVLVDEEPLARGSKDDVEGICNELIFGRSLLFENEPVDENRISIIKKIAIKVGLFIE